MGTAPAINSIRGTWANSVEAEVEAQIAQRFHLPVFKGTASLSCDRPNSWEMSGVARFWQNLLVVCVREANNQNQ